MPQQRLAFAHEHEADAIEPDWPVVQQVPTSREEEPCCEFFAVLAASRDSWEAVHRLAGCDFDEDDCSLVLCDDRNRAQPLGVFPARGDDGVALAFEEERARRLR